MAFVLAQSKPSHFIVFLQMINANGGYQKYSPKLLFHTEGKLNGSFPVLPNKYNMSTKCHGEAVIY